MSDEQVDIREHKARLSHWGTHKMHFENDVYGRARLVRDGQGQKLVGAGYCHGNSVNESTVIDAVRHATSKAGERDADT